MDLHICDFLPCESFLTLQRLAGNVCISHWCFLPWAPSNIHAIFNPEFVFAFFLFSTDIGVSHMDQMDIRVKIMALDLSVCMPPQHCAWLHLGYALSHGSKHKNISLFPLTIAFNWVFLKCSSAFQNSKHCSHKEANTNSLPRCVQWQ